MEDRDSLPPETASAQITLDEVEQAVTRIGRLGAGTSVRRLAMRTAVSLLGKPQPESIQPLIAALHNPSLARWREREMAAWTLGRMNLTDEDRDAAAGTLLGVLENAWRESLWEKSARILLRSASVGSAIGFILFIALSRGPGFFEALTMMSITAIPFVTPFSLVYDGLLNDRSRAAAARALGHLAVPEAVGPLAVAMFDKNPRVRAAAAIALHEVLPALKKEHFGRLGLESMNALGRALSHPDTSLVFKLLNALKLIGTGSAAPYVEKVVQSGRTMKLKDTAAEVLAVLRERQRRENEGGKLLRPVTHAPTIQPAVTSVEPQNEQQVLSAGFTNGQIDRN